MQNHRNRSIGLGISAVLLLLGVLLFVYDLQQSQAELPGKIKRNTYGGGKSVESLDVKVGNRKKEQIQVEIQERQYTKEQIQKIFSQCTSQMEYWILGENKSLDVVESDLQLIRQVPGEPVDVEWEMDRYDVINVYGELVKEAIESKGITVQLRATLTYRGDQKEQALFQCAAVLYPGKSKGGQRGAANVKRLVQQREEKNRTKAFVSLPEEVGGQSISYYIKRENRGIVLLVMAPVIAVLLLALEEQKKRKTALQWEKQMTRDYSELVSKLTLLLGAGMTAKSAWRRIASDYENHRGIRGERKVYEEMLITCYEMQSGIAEAEGYERFARRCNLPVYRKLGALLSQNLRKGTKGLCNLLKMEAVQAFEERKATARRLGEEAGTKLLMPMFLMLAIVLVVVVVPAFLSIQM